VTTGGKNHDFVDPRPRKSVHKDEVTINYKILLSNLQGMNPFCCKECGMTFALEETHEIHKNQHLKEKMMKIEGESIETVADLCSEEQWRNAGEIVLSNDKYRVNDSMWP